ncbi:unnamed protein product [Prorocentrum cordatum]|uniref:Uncharacterized protein n=1 Tax=Prorocentrum cordatum TaxID=2364126 RepID=A0ABN9RTT0_9DINO|nr:unnamed protein product [Polarella glacialis]
MWCRWCRRCRWCRSKRMNINSRSSRRRGGCEVDDGQSGGKVTRLVVRCSFLALPPVVAFFLGLTGYQLGFCVWATLVWSGLEAAIVFRTGLSMGCNRLPFVPRLVGAPVLDGS